MRTRWAWLLVATAACSAPVRQPEPARETCGWDRDDGKVAKLVVPKTGEPQQEGVPMGRLVLEAERTVTFGRVMAAAEPLLPGVLRIKVMVAPRELIGLTLPQKRPDPPKEQAVVSIVGTQRLVRSKGAPADRFGQLSIAGVRVRLQVENDAPRGTVLEIAELANHLANLQPPATVFGITATPETPWGSVLDTLVACACFDRKPKQEPHEVLLLRKTKSARGTH